MENLYYQAVKTSDELLHVRLYEWMVNNELTDKLLQVRGLAQLMQAIHVASFYLLAVACAFYDSVIAV